MEVKGKRTKEKRGLQSDRQRSSGILVSKLLHSALAKFVEDPSLRDTALKSAMQLVQADQLEALRTVLDTSDLSYRDALLIQLAYGTASVTPLDLTNRQVGGRGVAQRLGKWLAQNHIKSVSDC